MIRGLFQYALLSTLALVGCSSDSQPEEQDSGSSSSAVGCASDPRVTPFATGISTKSASGKFVAEIVNATPSPPRRGAGEAGMNTWVMKFGMDGQPIKDLKITTLMPDHGHGSPKVPVVTANPDGSATVSNIFFFMAGVWQITFTPMGAQEPATFSFCVQ